MHRLAITLNQLAGISDGQTIGTIRRRLESLPVSGTPVAVKRPDNKEFIMKEQTCDCPNCNCSVGTNGVERDGKHYCCQACADHHPKGQGCATSSGCKCGDKAQ